MGVKLSKDAVIGAEYDGESKFCIHYSKLRDGTSRETRQEAAIPPLNLHNCFGSGIQWQQHLGFVREKT